MLSKDYLGIATIGVIDRRHWGIPDTIARRA
jgi:hypothetical protein